MYCATQFVLRMTQFQELGRLYPFLHVTCFPCEKSESGEGSSLTQQLLLSIVRHFRASVQVIVSQCLFFSQESIYQSSLCRPLLLLFSQLSLSCKAQSVFSAHFGKIRSFCSTNRSCQHRVKTGG